MVTQLRIDQIHVDLLLSHVAFLRHLGKRSCQVNNCVAAIVLREQQNSKVLTLVLEAIRVCVLQGSIGWRVGAEVRRAEREGGLAIGTEVGFEGVPDAGVSLRQVVLKRTYVRISITLSV